MKDIRKRLLNACRENPSYKDKVLVLGNGPVPCDVMVIGEAPGRVETKLERPFVGRSGRFFVEILENALGRKRESVYITNAVKVWPKVLTGRPPEAGGAERGKTRPPTEREKRFFSKYLYEEIKAVNPRVVIAVGKVAFDALKKDLPFLPGRWVEGNGFRIMTVYHPAYIMRRQGMLKELSGELKKALSKVKRFVKTC